MQRRAVLRLREPGQDVISVPETEPHCSTRALAPEAWEAVVISVPETEPHCSPLRNDTCADA